jgi:hypothetical protein
MELGTINPDDEEEEEESAENTTTSTYPETAQIGPGSQENPIDLTIDDDSNPADNTDCESIVDSDFAEATDTPSIRFSLPRSMVIFAANSKMELLLTTLLALLFIHPSAVCIIPILSTLISMTWTSTTIFRSRNTISGLSARGTCSTRRIYDIHPKNIPVVSVSMTDFAMNFSGGDDFTLSAGHCSNANIELILSKSESCDR